MTARITAAMCSRGRTLTDPRISPDGTTVAFVASGSGGTALILVPSGGGPEAVLTTDPPISRGWGVFAWLPDGDGVVYVGGDGSLHVQPIVGGPPRQIAGTGGGGAAAPAVAPDGTQVAYTVDGRHVAVASVDPAGPWPVRLSAAPDFCVDPAWSADGTTVAWHEWDVPSMAWDWSRVVLACAPAPGPSLPVPGPPVAIAPGDSVATAPPGDSVATAPGDSVATAPGGPAVAVAQPRFSPDGSALGFLCDGRGWLNLWRAGPDGAGAAVLVEEASEHGGPTWGPGTRSWAWSPDGSRIAFTRNESGFGRLCLLEVGTGAVQTLDRGVFGGLSWSAGRLVALRSGARTPDQIVVYPDPGRAKRARDGRPERVAVARGPVLGFEAAGLIEPEVVHWAARQVDGIGHEVHGRLSRTARSADALPPLVVWLHGGPTGQHQVVFNPRAAYLLDRGWNILQVDPRGSTGWGRSYAQALTGRWGSLDVDDTVAAIRAAGREGWGDPERTVIMGASSAGLTVLSVLAHHPGLCAAGIDLYGVTDLFDLDETTHRFEAHYNPILLGALPGAAMEWTKRSPVTYCRGIVDPLLVLHGTADKVVSLSQSERLVATLTTLGAPVELHVYEGEGHGWSRPETVADELTRIDAFLTRYVLRGRRT